MKYLLPIALLLILSLFAVRAHASSSGPNNPASGVNDTSVVGRDWSNPENITSGSDSTFTSVFLSATGRESRRLIASDFGFSIPSDATVLGIDIDWRRDKLNISGGPQITDLEVRLIDGSGSLVGDNKASATQWPNNNPTTFSYGDSTDMWGTTLTPSDINADDFGVSLRSQVTGGSAAGRVYWAAITVYYTEAALPAVSQMQVRSGTIQIKSDITVIK